MGAYSYQNSRNCPKILGATLMTYASFILSIDKYWALTYKI
jgi:hypothetical protein